MKVTALIAAAGKSARMGTSKALLRVGDTTFIRHMAQRFLDAGVENLVVTLPECDTAALQIREEIADLRGIVFCRNNFPDHELLGSVQSAINLSCQRRLASSGTATKMDASLRWHDNTALLAMPIDVPCPTEEFLKFFLSQRTTAPSIYISTHANQPGHPILFTHHFFNEILQLSSGNTLRTILNRHHDKIVTLESDDPNLILNINTPADYARFTNPSAKYFDAAATEAPGAKFR